MSHADHCAKKSPDAVPPFGGLTRVVEGMEYPPGAYFGGSGDSLIYEDSKYGDEGDIFFCRAHATVPPMLDSTVTVTVLVGRVWFMAAAAPSNPRPTEIKTVDNGDRVDAGRIYLRNGGEFSTVVGLKDESGQFSMILLRGGDTHAVNSPSTVYLDEVRWIVWSPFE